MTCFYIKFLSNFLAALPYGQAVPAIIQILISLANAVATMDADKKYLRPTE
jgi:hypothetical protein